MARWIIGLLLTFIFCLYCGAGAAQEKISDEKKALIRELLELTQAAKNGEAVMNMFSVQMEKDLLQILEPIFTNGNTSLTKVQRDQLHNELLESSKRASQRMRELFKQRINFPQLIEDVSYEVYDAHYTTGELKDLLAFYKSPTGQKTIQITPVLMSDSMMKVSQRLNPQLQEITKQIVDEETKAVKKKLPASSPKKGSPRPTATSTSAKPNNRRRFL